MAYIYDLTDTWNAGGTTFYGIKMNVTNTASASGSKLLSLQVGGSEKFGVDKDGNVGVGTTSPGAKLDVQGSGSVYGRARSLDTTGGAIGYVGAEFAGGSALQIRAGAGYTYLVSTGASDPLLFGTNTTERMRIDASGNVGIGTTSPTFKFVSANNVSDGQWFGGSTTLSYMGLGNYRDAAGGAAQISYERTTGAFVFGNGSRDTPTERMRITSTGDVGIGTSSPTFKLQVEVDTNAAAGAFVRNLNTGAGASGSLAVSSAVGGISLRAHSAANSAWPNATLLISDSAFTGGMNFFQNGANPIAMWTNGSERMRITSAGNLQLGTASLATNATNGFPYIPTCAGTPTGTPTAITGYAPMVVDSTNNKLYVYVGGAWQAMN